MSVAHLETGTILIVDDNPTNLGVLFNTLNEAHFKVLVAEDGERALTQIDRTKPDIILLDVLMPGIDGFETCRRLKASEISVEIPVIFMTALSDTVDKIKGFEVGGVDYITKPLQHEEVLARVKAHLTIRQLQRKLKEQNELLHDKNLQLEELNANKDKFFSIIAHDLRSPFTGFLGLTQFIVENIDEWGKDKIKDITEKLHEAAENLYALLGNLLTWSRIQRGMVEHNPMTFDVADVISRNISLFTSNAKQKEITLETSVPAGAAVYADPQMVDTVIRNLLSNALKFTQTGGIIKIAAEQPAPQLADHADERLHLSVTDNGIGIPDSKIDQLFRIDAKYKRPGTAGEQGTGLGLVLCKELVEKNGGTIRAESVERQGTTFTFSLRRAAPEKSDE